MKIAFVNNQRQLGGAETVVQQLHQGCLQAGHEADFLVAEGKHYPADVVPMYPRLLSRLSHSRFSGQVEALFPRQKWTNHTFEKLADSDYDLIHIHNFHGHYATIEALAKLSERKPVLWTFHRFWGITGGCDHPKDCLRYREQCGECPLLGEWPLGMVDNTREQLALKMQWLRDAPLHIIAPSKHLMQTVESSRVGERWKVTHIPNGVDLRLFGYQRKRDAGFRRSLGISEDAVTLLITNRDFRDPIKGFQYLAPELEKINPAGIEILLAGRGTERARDTLSQFRCHDFGYVSDRERLAELYEAADIYLYASQGENFPCATLEAMASECRVVSTPTDGVLEQIDNGVSGYFSERIDAESFARALKSVLENFDPRQNPVGRAARERAETEFSEAQMVERHFEVYRDALSP